jgi:hypothetical protein
MAYTSPWFPQDPSLNPSATSRGVATPFGSGRPYIVPNGMFTGTDGRVGFVGRDDNANSAFIKFGKKDPMAEEAARSPVSRELLGQQAAGGGELKWDPTHHNWYVAGGNNPTQTQVSTALDAINKYTQTPVGTSALNLFNQRFGTQTSPQPQQAQQFGYRPLWG